MNPEDLVSRRRLLLQPEGLEERALLSIARPHVAEVAGSHSEVSAASRSSFTAAFLGRSTSSPASAGAHRRLFFRGSGSSSAFLHGSLLMTLTTPDDPSGQVIGTASLFDRNY